jgi:hypothetical protein
MLAVELINDDGFQVCAILATVLFAIAAVMAVIERAIVMALLCAGATAFALGWVLIS